MTDVCDRCGDDTESVTIIAVEGGINGMLDRKLCEDCFDDMAKWWEEGWAKTTA